MDTHIEKQTHPLVIIAAMFVILFCGTGIAAIFGWLPHTRADQTAQPAPVAAKEAPATQAQPEAARPEPIPAAAAKPAAPTPHKTVAKAHTHAQPKPAPVARTEPALDAPAPVAAPAPVQVAQLPPPPAPVRAVCPNCGVVDNVREVEKPGEATGLGAVGGAVVGGVVGHQMGGGRGRDIMTVLGALGGGLAGHQVEKNVRKSSEYQTVVRFENGSTQVFTSSAVPSWRIGEKVKVVNGAIEPNG
jgi:outer membrane lipoprotein SlyB